MVTFSPNTQNLIFRVECQRNKKIHKGPVQNVSMEHYEWNKTIPLSALHVYSTVKPCSASLLHLIQRSTKLETVFSVDDVIKRTVSALRCIHSVMTGSRSQYRDGITSVLSFGPELRYRNGYLGEKKLDWCIPRPTSVRSNHYPAVWSQHDTSSTTLNPTTWISQVSPHMLGDEKVKSVFVVSRWGGFGFTWLNVKRRTLTLSGGPIPNSESQYCVFYCPHKVNFDFVCLFVSFVWEAHSVFIFPGAKCAEFGIQFFHFQHFPNTEPVYFGRLTHVGLISSNKKCSFHFHLHFSLRGNWVQSVGWLKPAGAFMCNCTGIMT